MATMTALAIGLHLHPFGCWIVQQKLAEYLETLMALRLRSRSSSRHFGHMH